MSHFEQALKKLVEDHDFRDAVINEPGRLSHDFEDLQPQEVLLLMQVWQASGDPEAESFVITVCHCCCCSR